MITYRTRIGTVTLSNEYFSELIGNAVSTCYGVCAMKPHGLKKWISKITGKNSVSNSVKISGDINSVCVEIHIGVIYGVNINTIAKSIVNKVKYTIQEATGINVDKVTVKIDGIAD